MISISHLFLCWQLFNSSQSITMDDYNFVAPEGWQVQRFQDHIRIQNTESGCTILILEPQPSSGNLEQDANTVFNLMYSGWQFQKTGEQQYVLTKGYLPCGLNFFMAEAPMSMTNSSGQYILEDGVALVIKAGDQIVIVAVRHNSSLLAHGDCIRKYETWRRFFNSFTVKNVPIPKNTEDDSAKKIIGVWKLTSVGPALGEYIFAANGNYQFGGAIGTSFTTSEHDHEYLHISTYDFQGDGSYSINENQLYLNKHGAENSEYVQIRFEKVNHGGIGWKDRLYLLKSDTLLGNMYEVCYEKAL